ncbi:phosphotransferase family protein [Nocardia alba]|uniref:Phosphotransferase family enzyme n=1 Tax=Nocardia alba TaxID=225051 RepID=A0A4R1FVD1_9NOCA|nr:aminoglycoside phosphotransferase family protein [Nocardia alba]TCJ97719.1 phosphotransferase family enzyme [Nocardia alba]
MTSRSSATALGIGMVAKEAIRVGFDRTIAGRKGIPLRVEQVTAQWLGDALELTPGAIESVRVVQQDSGTAARARIAVKSDADIPDHLFLKLAPRNYLQHVLMNVFALGIHECLAYQALGSNPPVRIPRCHAVQVDLATQRTFLALEDLSETAEFRTVIDSVTRTEASAVVDALADLHATFWRTDRFTQDLAPLAVRSAAEIRIGDIIRRRFLGEITGHTADLIPEPIKRQCRMLFENSTAIDAFWESRPQTLIHGDPHLGNLFFEGANPGFLDWQVAKAGAGIRDVAYFASASVEPDLLRTIERDLVERYAGRLDAAGIAVDGDDLWSQYRAAITEFFLAAVCTAEAGARMQPLDVSRVGVERAVAGVVAHDSFTVLAAFTDGKPV